MICIFYHKDDNDGVFSGALIKYHLVNNNKVPESSIKLFPSDYDFLNNFNSDELNDLLDNAESVFIADCSFNDIKRMKSVCKRKNVYWYDHHAPIIRESVKQKFDDVKGLRDVNCSALMCVYRDLYTDFDSEWREGRLPVMLDMLSSYDSFTFETRGYTKEDCYNFNTAINNKYNLNFDKVYDSIEYFIRKNIANSVVSKFIKEGEEYNNGFLNYWGRIIDDSGDFNWFVDGRPAVAMFTQGPTSSILFDRSDKSKYIKNAIMFKRIPNGSWGISLYNLNEADDFDCGAYLKKKYKGGGHKGAAGCTLTEQKFVKRLKEKVL